MALKIENRKIETVGQLRSFLCESIVDVRNGNIRVEIASQINKMAAQVNESFYSECKVARTMKDNRWSSGN